MLKLQKTGLLFALIGSNMAVFGQKKIELSVKYDQQSDTYAVYAKPNFSQRDFTWGPSQITVILPATMPDEKLRIRNVDGGAWEDNSLIFSPEVDANKDFHGFASSGNKTNLVEGNESILFYFTLPSKVAEGDVRVFDNEKDPKSTEQGMKGGDFGNSIADALGNDLYSGIYGKSKAVKERKSEIAKTAAIDENSVLTLYPNTTKDIFNVSLNGIEDTEQVTMFVATEVGREIMRINTTKQNLESRTFRLPAEITNQNLVVRVKTNSSVFGKRLIVDKDQN